MGVHNFVYIALAMAICSTHAKANPYPRDFLPLGSESHESIHVISPRLQWKAEKALDISKSAGIDEWNEVNKRLGVLYKGDGFEPNYVWIYNGTHVIQLMEMSASDGAHLEFNQNSHPDDLLLVVPLLSEE